MTKALGLHVWALLAFLLSTFLVGSKVLLAVAVGRSKSILRGRAYLYTMRFLGFVLGVLACVLFYDGLRLLGVVAS